MHKTEPSDIGNVDFIGYFRYKAFIALIFPKAQVFDKKLPPDGKIAVFGDYKIDKDFGCLLIFKFGGGIRQKPCRIVIAEKKGGLFTLGKRFCTE